MADLLVLALLEERPRHGYEIARRIETRTAGTLRFHVASLYTLLGRLERRGWIEGRWVERAGERRRRFYRLTPAGRAALQRERAEWREFLEAVRSIAGVGHAELA